MKVLASVIVNGGVAEDRDDLEIIMETVKGYYALAYDEVKIEFTRVQEQQD
jgi:hypothetical protein